MYLIIDGGAEVNHQEAVGHHREDAQDGGEEDRQPNVGLVQRVSGCSWINTRVQSFRTTLLSTIYIIYSRLKTLELTYEREGWRQHEEHAVAVHGERDSKVHGQAAQNKERVHHRPVGHLEPELQTHSHRKTTGLRGHSLTILIQMQSFVIPGCWPQTADKSEWGVQRTGSQQRPSHRPSPCCTWRRRGWRRAPRSCSSCGEHTWRRTSYWSKGWVGRGRRAEGAGSSTRRSHPEQQGETENRDV